MNQQFVGSGWAVAVPNPKVDQVVLSDYATHKTPKVKEGLPRHPRFHLPFTPTRSSWLDVVERWFAELATRKLRRSATAALPNSEAKSAIRLMNGRRLKPFHWTGTPGEILETLAADCQN